MEDHENADHKKEEESGPLDCDEKIPMDDLTKLIKHELAPPPIIPSATSSENSSEVISVFEDTPGTRVFDKHAVDLGVASRVIKAIQDFKDAARENKTSSPDLSKDESEKETIGVQGKSEAKKKTRTLKEALKEKRDDDEQPSLLPPLFTRVHQGLTQLYELIDDGTESVKNVRVAAIRDEIERLKDDQCERFALEGYIAKKELEALEEYKKIDEKWEKISQLKDPLNIHNETLAQREKCNALLQEKDNVIQFLRETLKKKDETFLNEVENQGNDIDILIDRIQNQIYIFKETYTKQLETLEEIIDEEKRIMIETNREKWESLIQDKEEVDKAVLEKLTNIMDTHENAMRLAEKEQNEYQRKIRSKLHKYINDLTVQVDHLKSICTLNIEKMTYNYHILLKKQQENQFIKQRCKRYAARMKNDLNVLRKQIKEGSQTLANQLVEKSNKIDRLQDKINTMDNRCEALIASESKVYFDLWEFNEKRAQNLLDQIFAADKMLYEQVLFMPWTPPEYTRLEKSILPSYKEAKKLSEYMKKKGKMTPRQLPKILIENQSQTERLTKIILDSLKSTCPFFLDEQRKTEISHLPAVDQNLFELENVFEALGLQTKSDVELMIKYFLPYVTCGACIEEADDIKKFKESEKESLFESLDTKTETSSAQISEQKESHGKKKELLKTEDSFQRTDLNTGKEIDKEDYLLSDVVSQRLQIISNVVVDETLGAEEYDTNKRFEMTDKEIDYKRNSKIFEASSTDKQDVFQKDDIISLQKFFGVHEHSFPVDWLTNKLNKAPVGFSEEDVPAKEEKEECLMICSDPSHQPFVNPIDIAKALRDFTVDFYKAKEKQTNLTMEDILAKPRMAPSRVMDPDDVSNYWKAYTEFFPPQKIRLWETMLCAIQDYQKALHKRHHLNIELKKIQRQNIELRRLLQRYIHKSPPVPKSGMLLAGLASMESDF